MDTVITFTPSQLVTIILAVCAAIVTISAAIGVISGGLAKIKQPDLDRDKRLDTCEKRLDALDEIVNKFKEYFDNDDRRFKEIEKSNKITQSALLALLKHSISGEDLTSLKEAEKSLEAYLIEK